MKPVTIDIVVQKGVIGDGIPIQINFFVVKDGIVIDEEVFRVVELSGERPSRTAHAINARIVFELNVPIITAVLR